MDNDFDEFIRYVEEDPYLRDNKNPLEWYSNTEQMQKVRFSRHTIMHIIMPLVYPLRENINNRGVPVPPILKIYYALRFFATGSYERVCGDLLSVSQSSMSRIINEVSDCQDIWDNMCFFLTTMLIFKI
ncbi:hypothetical protein RI129_007268 [Pyrocoelia pectoralis]|uniref:Nuclease HARBI1 n=1 Tax=Pyrocoelia pectoralis TaxID=417401 RepID=A0AAN7VAT6_9COLE